MLQWIVPKHVRPVQDRCVLSLSLTNWTHLDWSWPQLALLASDLRSHWFIRCSAISHFHIPLLFTFTCLILLLTYILWMSGHRSKNPRFPSLWSFPSALARNCQGTSRCPSHLSWYVLDCILPPRRRNSIVLCLHFLWEMNGKLSPSSRQQTDTLIALLHWSLIPPPFINMVLELEAPGQHHLQKSELKSFGTQFPTALGTGLAYCQQCKPRLQTPILEWQTFEKCTGDNDYTH